MLELLKADIKPSDVLKRTSFENAITLVMALGGSTNAVLHLLAIAHAAGVPLTLDDFQVNPQVFVYHVRLLSIWRSSDPRRLPGHPLPRGAFLFITCPSYENGVPFTLDGFQVPLPPWRSFLPTSALPVGMGFLSPSMTSRSRPPPRVFFFITFPFLIWLVVSCLV